MAEIYQKNMNSTGRPPGFLSWLTPQRFGRQQLFNMLDIKTATKHNFARATNLQEVFNRIDELRKTLGFSGLVVCRPLNDKWVTTERAQDWASPFKAGKYDLGIGGGFPETTLKSIVEDQSDRRIYIVDIKKESTFLAEGLVPDHNSIKNDLSNSKGPSEMIFIRLISDKRVEAVIQLHNRVKEGHKLTARSILPENPQMRRRVLAELEEIFSVAEKAIQTIRNSESEKGQEAADHIFVPKAAKLLTDDGLYRPQDGIPYPRNATEFTALMRLLLNEKGIFPGDSEPLTEMIKGEMFFSPPLDGTSHVILRRKGLFFRAEDFSPREHCRGKENGLIFIADLISQIASFDSYGMVGCSYDRGPYYEKRFLGSDRVPFVWAGNWPVSFATLQGFKTSFNEKELFYAFIHFVMTIGNYQKYGLTSYSVREAVSSLFYYNLWPKHHAKNLMYNADAALKDHRLKMWIAAHSGRLSAFRAFVNGFGGVINPQYNESIGKAIIEDAHKRITPPRETMKKSPEYLGAVEANDRKIILARDEGIYPAENRYPIKDGKVMLPESEVDLPESTIAPWYKAIGGNEGVENGNGLYFLAMLNFFMIQAAKSREKSMEQGRMEGLGEWFRQWAVTK